MILVSLSVNLIAGEFPATIKWFINTITILYSIHVLKTRFILFHYFLKRRFVMELSIRVSFEHLLVQRSVVLCWVWIRWDTNNYYIFSRLCNLYFKGKDSLGLQFSKSNAMIYLNYNWKIILFFFYITQHDMF